VPPADKQNSSSTLSEKVHEMAQFYLSQKEDVSPGPSKLSPIPDTMATNDKVLDWITQTTQIDNSCISLLQDMELCQEEDVIYDSQIQDLSQMELVVHLDLVPISKQAKKWGPVARTRKSSRLSNNEGKIVLQLAQELAQKKTLEKVVPASSRVTGTSSSNPFEVISPYSFMDIANTVGIDTSLVNCDQKSPVLDNSFPANKTIPAHLKGPNYGDEFPDALCWSSIKRKTRRGKHPMTDSSR
jgi:hypothetical protein